VDTKLPVRQDELIIYTLSDASGMTATQLAEAALVQFPPGLASIYRLPQAIGCQQVSALVREVSAGRAVIAYTLAVPEYREALETTAREHGVATADLFSPLVGKVAEITASRPAARPGRAHLDEAYYRRIEAVNFAVRFDDGKNPVGIAQADVVLVGLSRTGKTPVCMYLAQNWGVKAANVPVVPGVDLPPALFTMPAKKIIALAADPFFLQSVRRTRADLGNMSVDSPYANLDDIQAEVQLAKGAFAELKCWVINISAKAVEEVASEIFMYLNQ
jgi:regulator of PEP synthase PpsR (kinase-PPPase family)